MSTAVESRVYSIREAARLAGVRCIRIGRRVLIPKEAFDRMLVGVVANDETVGQRGYRSTPVQVISRKPIRTDTLRSTVRLQGMLEYVDETLSVIVDFRLSGHWKSGRFLIVAVILAIQAITIS